MAPKREYQLLMPKTTILRFVAFTNIDWLCPLWARNFANDGERENLGGARKNAWLPSIVVLTPLMEIHNGGQACIAMKRTQGLIKIAV